MLLPTITTILVITLLILFGVFYIFTDTILDWIEKQREKNRLAEIKYNHNMKICDECDSILKRLNYLSSEIKRRNYKNCNDLLYSKDKLLKEYNHLLTKLK